MARFVLFHRDMSRSQHPQTPSKPAPTQSTVTPNTTVVKNAQVASKAPRSEVRPAPVEPHWEPVIDLATD